jgi:hypothetical protein
MAKTSAKLAFLENVLRSSGVVVRYEKGHFQSGYCLLKDKRVAVINKFYKDNARLRIIREIISQVAIDTSELKEEDIELLDRLAPKWRETSMFVDTSGGRQ